jgi:uncharacterized protein YkwD
LQAAAQEKADDMVKNGYFAHTSPLGVTPWYWFGNVGYDFSYAGENLAVNFSDSQDVTNAWMNSPEHRANILNAHYTNIGMAIATGTFQGQSAIYVVELFGTPAIVPVAVAPSAGNNKNVVALAKAKPKSATVSIASVPIIVSTSVAQASASQAASVAVKGAATANLPATETVAQAAPTAPVFVSRSNGDLVQQSNPVQEALASPRQLSNDFYLLLIVIMAGALLINLLIKVRIQHPQLIFNGVFVIAIAALCVVLNQHQLLAHAMIF